MNVQHELRTGEDRRRFAQHSRYGNERRTNKRSRRLETVAETQPYLAGSGPQRHYCEAPDRTSQILHEIAEAFSVHPGSLELVESDDLLDSTEICQSCEKLVRQNEELKAELATNQKDSDRYRTRARAFLLAFNSSRQ